MSNVVKLPDSYAKHKESNNYKLLYLNEQAIADAKADAEAVYNMVDLQQATGRTLDLYGSIIGQQRGTLNDIQYRALILTRVGMNISQGTYASIIESLNNIFKCENGDIVLNDGAGSCEVYVEKIPLIALVNADLSSEQAVEVIESLLPIGVRLNTDIEYYGTLEFADTEDVYDAMAGFGNVAQTIGGYLGMLQGDDEKGGILPL